jgi:UDP-glucose 4-epimerase
MARDNLEMLFNLLEFCRLNDIKKFIFASSREVYGNSGLSLCTEEDARVKNCESPYTASKIGGEALIHAYHQCYGIDFIILRFSNVYGMYDDSDRVIPRFIRQTLKNEDLTVYGKNKMLDFTYIDDTVDGIIRCVEHFSKVKNSVFNIASGKSVPIIEIAEQIIQGMRGKNSVVLKNNRRGEVIQSSIDISKAHRELGYSPKTQIHDGIKKTLVNYKTIINE